MSPTTLAPDDPRHGKPSTYSNHGCRCDACRAAKAADQRLRYTRGSPKGPVKLAERLRVTRERLGAQIARQEAELAATRALLEALL